MADDPRRAYRRRAAGPGELEVDHISLAVFVQFPDDGLAAHGGFLDSFEQQRGVLLVDAQERFKQERFVLALIVFWIKRITVQLSRVYHRSFAVRQLHALYSPRIGNQGAACRLVSQHGL
jgi:hypothetical protein